MFPNYTNDEYLKNPILSWTNCVKTLKLHHTVLSYITTRLANDFQIRKFFITARYQKKFLKIASKQNLFVDKKLTKSVFEKLGNVSSRTGPAPPRPPRPESRVPGNFTTWRPPTKQQDGIPISTQQTCGYGEKGIDIYQKYGDPTASGLALAGCGGKAGPPT